MPLILRNAQVKTWTSLLCGGGRSLDQRLCATSTALLCVGRPKKIKAVVSTLKETMMGGGGGGAFSGSQCDHGQPRQKITPRVDMPSLPVCPSGIHAWEGDVPPGSWTCPRRQGQSDGQQGFTCPHHPMLLFLTSLSSASLFGKQWWKYNKEAQV